MALNLNELSFENIGVWPWPAKMIVIGLVIVVMAVIGSMLDAKPQLRKLAVAENRELDLRTSFEIKHEQAANLPLYREQVQQMKKIFSGMLQQLPGSSEVPSLIEDISKMGVASGLEFKLIKPDAEIDKDFYAELPIQISVTGDYHQLAEFISSIASLQRIVTIDDFTIKKLKQAQAGRGQVDAGDDTLVMDIVAKTYRYLDPNRQQQGAEQQQ